MPHRLRRAAEPLVLGSSPALTATLIEVLGRVGIHVADDRRWVSSCGRGGGGSGWCGEVVRHFDQAQRHLVAAAMAGVDEVELGVRPGLRELPGGVLG